MAFDIYTYVVPAAGLKAGDAFTLPYAAGRTSLKYRPAGSHFASGANALLVTAPSKFTVSFNAPNIAIVWNGSRLAPHTILRFQFESVDGLTGEDGKEIAHANADNIDTTALGFVPVNSPIFTGNPTAPTPLPGDNDFSIATTAFVQAAIAAAITALVNASPAALDTLAELATALGNDASFATTMTTALGLKAPLANPSFTGTAIFQNLRLTSVAPAALSVATTPDYNPSTTANHLRISATLAATLTGLNTTPAASKLLALVNVGAFNITLANENALSAAANRFHLGADRVLLPDDAILLIYDGTTLRWRDASAVPAALAAALQLGTEAARFLTPAAIFGAAAPVAVAFAATQTLDLSTGINFDIAAATANFQLANPSAGMTPGRSGRIRLPQDATGGRIISYGTWWKAPGGPLALSTPASAVDCLYYFVRTATEIEYTLIKAFA